MKVIDITSLVNGGIIQEEPFRKAVENFNWEQFKGKRVLVQGCGAVPIPIWAYMMVTAKLSQYASSINYGEVKNPFLVFQSKSK
jgi:hypothetical protein